ncbi:MAG TPA: hydrogenase nickel incorporation protein HypB [Vulgatibacter sp.]|nr:hydrogenase nickel incorporation protein HypB [Vulgatibacter sp.]
MCAICGCGAAGHHHEDEGHVHGQGEGPVHVHAHGGEAGHLRDHVHAVEAEHDPGHAHGGEAGHAPVHVQGDEPGHVHGYARGLAAGARMLRIEQELLARNDRLAARNRGWLEARGIVALNLVGAPGTGKTSLLEETARRLAGAVEISVLEGDQETDADARRIRAAGCRALQINTGAGCHLDAAMIEGALARLFPARGSILFVENVGNLVCPALFDLGEAAKVVVLSVTEGDDKPLKYPHVFRAADVFVLNKTDLLPHVHFDVEACMTNARRMNPDLQIFRTSARTGEGMDVWCGWLAGLVEGRREVTMEGAR